MNERPLWERLPYPPAPGANLPELDVGIGIAKLRIKLTIFVGIYRKLSGQINRDDVRRALGDMGVEVAQTYETVVNALSPLYAIRDEDHMAREFPTIRAEFKKAYLKSSHVVHVHCGVVQEKLQIMLNARSWHSKVPVAKRSYAELKEICRRWLVDDESMVQEMNEFFTVLNRFLDRVERVRRSNPSEAYAQIQDFLSQIEPDFLAIRRAISDLASGSRAVA